MDSDDDKYNKRANANNARKPLPRPKFQTPDPKRENEYAKARDVYLQSKSQNSSPIQGKRGNDDGTRDSFNAGRLQAKLDFLSAKVNFDGEEAAQVKVHNALDRLALAGQIHNTVDAFGEAVRDMKEEVGEYASKAAESLARFQATQYAAKWMPIETNVNLKPTYVKVPVQTVERLKFYEDENVRQIVATHLIEKEQILAENAGLRSLIPGLQDDISSEAVMNIRETEDGVNRALLLAAVEEIAKLKTRVTVLEGEAAKHRVTSAGFGLIGMDSAHSGEIAEHARKLTNELARVEEDNGRQKWLIGEKDKEIEMIKGKFTDTYQYSLEERLQESTEALEVAANLQGEQLQYLEDHALKVLAEKNEKLDDLCYQLETLASHREQAREHLIAFLERSDENVVSILCSLAGFSSKKTKDIVDGRRSRSLTGRLAWLGKKVAPMMNSLYACASPAGGIPREGDVIRELATTDDDDERKEPSSDDSTNAAAPVAKKTKDDEEETIAVGAEKVVVADSSGRNVEDGKASTASAEKEENATISSSSTTTTIPERSRSRPKPKSPRNKHDGAGGGGFLGFDDPIASAKEAKKRAKERGPLPAPKLIGRAAEREAEKMREREKSGFGGFGDESSSSSDSD